MASYFNYTVKSGDILSQIALKHGTTVSAISSLNGIANANSINVGQVFRIPYSSSGSGSNGSSSSSSSYITYTIKSGDTLSGIAVKYLTTVSTLCSINGISNRNKINVGQVIKIPRSGSSQGSSSECSSSSGGSPSPEGNFSGTITMEQMRSIGWNF